MMNFAFLNLDPIFISMYLFRTDERLRKINLEVELTYELLP